MYVMICYVKLCYVMFVPLRDAPMTRWPEAFSRVVPERDACVITLRFVVPLGDAPMTRWPEAFSSVVPEVIACVITLGLESAKSYLGLGRSRSNCSRHYFRVRVGEVPPR